MVLSILRRQIRKWKTDLKSILLLKGFAVCQEFHTVIQEVQINARVLHISSSLVYKAVLESTAQTQSRNVPCLETQIE